jgi:site-specific recombinase XerD
MPARDTAGFFELKLAIDLVNKDKNITTFCKSRHIFCLFLLYTTGLRVSNLLKLQVRHVHQMLENQQFDLGLIKKRDSIVQTFCLPDIVYDFLQKELMQYVNELIQGKKDSEFVITAQKSENKSKSITRGLLNKDLNRILKEVSKSTHKNLKTHSFRINLTTSLIQAVGIHDASKVIGHKDIRTTERYNRSVITPIQAKNAYELAHIHNKDTFVDRRKKSEKYTLQKEINKQLNKKGGKVE